MCAHLQAVRISKLRRNYIQNVQAVQCTHIKTVETAYKMSYIINDCQVDAGFDQEFCDFLLFQRRRDVQRSVSILQTVQTRTY